MVSKGWKRVYVFWDNNRQEIVVHQDSCKKELRKWSKEVFPNNKKVVDELMVKLQACNEGIWDENTKIKAKKIVKQIDKVWRREEIF